MVTHLVAPVSNALVSIAGLMHVDDTGLYTFDNRGNSSEVLVVKVWLLLHA